MIFDEDGLLEEPCISCDKSYVDDLFYEWHCDEKECPYKKEKEVGMKVYMVNVETYYAGYGIRRCLGGIFDSLEKAEKYCNDLKEKIRDTEPKLGCELEYYIDEVNLNRGHSLTFIGYNNDYLRVDADFEDREILLGGYIE